MTIALYHEHNGICAYTINPSNRNHACTVIWCGKCVAITKVHSLMSKGMLSLPRIWYQVYLYYCRHHMEQLFLVLNILGLMKFIYLNINTELSDFWQRPINRLNTELLKHYALCCGMFYYYDLVYVNWTKMIYEEYMST